MLKGRKKTISDNKTVNNGLLTFLPKLLPSNSLFSKLKSIDYASFRSPIDSFSTGNCFH